MTDTTPTAVVRQIENSLVAGLSTDGDATMRRELRDALDRLDVGVPGAGRTGARWLALHDLAVVDVALARLGEAHLDATAILAEAGRAPRPGAVYGVWAAAGPAGPAVRLESGRLHGTKPFCSGIGIVDRALIDVETDAGYQLVDADVAFVRDGASWRSPSTSSSAAIEWHHAGLTACNTGTVVLDEVSDVETIGRPGWYLDRVGFWHGACGPAACWSGGAAGLFPETDPGDDPHRLAAAGEVAADVWAMRAVLQQAGDEIDLLPDDLVRARRRARTVRHVVHELATRVLDRFARAWGPRPIVADRAVAQRVADVEIYLRQHHDARDLAALGRDTWPDHGGPR